MKLHCVLFTVYAECVRSLVSYGLISEIILLNIANCFRNELGNYNVCTKRETIVNAA